MPAPMPPFFGSPNRMSVIIALAKHGACTTEELRVLLGHQTKRSLFRSLGELEELGVVTSYPWNERWPNRQKRPASKFGSTLNVWELDRRHPWIWQIRTFGRRLAIGFSLPGDAEILQVRGVRPERAPTAPWSYRDYKGPTPIPEPFDLFGKWAAHRILMFLAHVGRNGCPITTLVKILGISRFGGMESVNQLEVVGVVRSSLQGTERRLSLNREFCAYNALRQLALRMDRDLGRENEALALARKVDLGIRSLRQHRARQKKKPKN